MGRRDFLPRYRRCTLCAAALLLHLHAVAADLPLAAEAHDRPIDFPPERLWPPNGPQQP